MLVVYYVHDLYSEINMSTVYLTQHKHGWQDTMVDEVILVGVACPSHRTTDMFGLRNNLVNYLLTYFFHLVCEIK
jgi:hypothetical protein